jgi:formylglycine-generating enzyme required for sulfatase activity
MVCHPGGLFVIGDPYFFPDDPDLAAIPEHLVQLPPFALDEDEVTVGQVRALVGTGEIAGAPLTRGAAGSAEEACTFLGPANDANDALPVNCISRAVAEDICAVLGKRLPTEAEWEFAAVNRTRETRFPWGDEENACDYAVVGRGRFVTEVVDLVDESVVCRATGVSVPWGPAAGGEAGDITDLGVRNLAGNVSEWVADRYQRYDEPCWNPGPTLIMGPRCDEPSAQVGLRWSVRGGNWAGPVFQTRSVERHALLEGPSVAIGFRCAASL